jgi:hypothetical protein
MKEGKKANFLWSMMSTGKGKQVVPGIGRHHRGREWTI